MPWRLPVANQPVVMRFTGDSNSLGCPAPSLEPKVPITDLLNLPKVQPKRKSWDCEIEYPTPPLKQLITEEKMAENLNCMHISNSYVSHQIGSNQPMSIPLPESPSLTSPEPVSVSSSDSSSSMLDSSLDGKDRTVALCEQLRKLISESSVIPSPLLNKVERPCNALVLWQPPGGSIFKNLEKASSSNDQEEEVTLQSKQERESKPSASDQNFSSESSNENSWDDLMDNNNSTNAMDLNLFASSSSSSQLLPSEVPLPDDDFMEDSMMDF